MSTTSEAIIWQSPPQARPDFGVRVSIAPYRASLPFLHVTISRRVLYNLNWSVGCTVGLDLGYRGGRPVCAALRQRLGNQGGRMLRRAVGNTGSGQVSFMLPAELDCARTISQSLAFREDPAFEPETPADDQFHDVAETVTALYHGLLTIDLSPLFGPAAAPKGAAS